MSRKLSECVRLHERIRHRFKDQQGNLKYEYAIYLGNNELLPIRDDGLKTYVGRSPLNQFTENNYRIHRPDRTFRNNAWKQCEILRDDEWISMLNLEAIPAPP